VTTTAEAPGRPAATQGRQPGGVAVVIDDDPASQELMRRSLGRGGYRVLVAGTGEAGLGLARELAPSVIFLDVVLPGMDGWEVLAAVKADPRLAAVPVVMMTMLDERKKAQALEADGFLLKPVDRSRLTAVLAGLAPGGAEQPPLAEAATRQPEAQGEATAAPSAPPTPPSASDGPILLVEDDPTNRQILARTLRKQGLPVVEAADGQAALERVHEAPPSLIILDLMLPVMDGLTFVQRLRAEPAHRGIPIIVLTAKDLTAEDRGRMGDSVRKVFQKGSCKRDDILGEVARFRAAT
jgi:CheY-like chemotaxis protein